MIQKNYKNIKNFFKNPKEVIAFFLPIIIMIVLLIPLDYTVTFPTGGTINIDKKIIVNNEYPVEGSINSAFVRQSKGNVLMVLISKIIPNFELEKNETIVSDNETIEDYNFRNKLYFKSSIDSSIKLAYEKATGKDVNVTSSKIYVIYVDKNSKSNLKVQDEILKVDGKDVLSTKDIFNILANYKENDLVTVTVKRNNKQINVTSKLININNEAKLGVSITTLYDYDIDDNIKFNFSNKESGPSGGLMFTLSIYNKLTKADITNGKKIVGTGTIDENGNVGEIGGVKYKFLGAIKEKADIFICPYENYDEVIELKNKNNYNINIIKVSSFSEAIEKLSNIN